MKARRLITSSILAIALTSLVGCDNPLTKLFGKKEEVPTFKVVWKNYDGSILEIDENVAKDTMAEYNGKQPTKPTDDGSVYTFVGWSEAIAPVIEDTEYTAVFTSSPREYTIMWLDYDNSLLATSSVAYGQTPRYPKSQNPSRANTVEFDYEFAGWDRELVPVTGATSYKAVYNATRYDVVYLEYQFPATKHDVINNNVTAVRAGESVELEDASCAGYDFAGWYQDADRTKQVSTLPNLHESKVIYGSFNVHTYSISYNLNGGELAEGEENITSITCLEKFTLKNPSKFGHKFSKWLDERGQEVKELDDVCEDKLLTANYEANKHKITLKFMETESITIDVLYGQAIDLSPYTPSSDTYDFVGWYYEGTELKFEETVYTLDYSIVLVPQWKIHEFTAYLNPNGGELASGEQLPATLKFTAEEQPELPVLIREGYDFLGWFEGNTKIDSLNGIYRDINLVAKWQVRGVNITFDYNGGSLQRLVTFKDGDNIVKEAKVSPFETVGFELLDDKANAQFNGWINEAENMREGFISNEPKELHADTVLTAAWAELEEGAKAAKIGDDAEFEVYGFNNVTFQYTPLVTQTVTFKSAGDVDVQANLYERASGMLIAGNDDISSTDRNFTFQYTLVANVTYLLKVSSNYEGFGTSSIRTESNVSSEDMAPKGLLKGDEYRVTSSQQNYWDIFNTDLYPVKENCEFLGWFDADDKLYESGDTVLKNENIVLTAKWNELN